jgi:CO/xanthine dehydrogenase Mo-binding subunit
MTWIGSSPVRPDADDKIRGRAMYAFDLAIDGMLFARVLRSPVPAGRIVSLDTRRARAMPGVRAVVTAADGPATLAGEFLIDTPLFAHESVRYVGEPIAAVAADTLEAANIAVAAIALDIASGPAVTTLDEALAPGAPLVHPDAATYATQYGLIIRCEGNLVAQLLVDPDGVNQAFAKAYQVVEDTIEGQRQYQGYLESRNAVATFTDERLEVHVGHQHSSALRERLAQFFALDVERIRIRGYTIGGGFGGKLEFGPEPYAAALSRAAGGRPVKLVFDRGEDLGVATCRENSRVRLRSAIDRAGNVLAREIDVLLDNGAYMMDQALSPSLAAYIGAANYQCGPLRARSGLVYTNTPPTGAMRGVTGVILTAALEKHVDHICRIVGRDRHAYRVERLVQDGYVMPSGQVLDDAHILADAFAAVEGKANWAEARARTSHATARHRDRRRHVVCKPQPRSRKASNERKRSSGSRDRRQ